MAKIATASRRITPNGRPASSAGRQDSASTAQQIERLAYQFFVERGYQHGYDREDWARAEAIVKGRRS